MPPSWYYGVPFFSEIRKGWVPQKDFEIIPDGNAAVEAAESSSAESTSVTFPPSEFEPDESGVAHGTQPLKAAAASFQYCVYRDYVGIFVYRPTLGILAASPEIRTLRARVREFLRSFGELSARALVLI